MDRWMWLHFSDLMALPSRRVNKVDRSILLALEQAATKVAMPHCAAGGGGNGMPEGTHRQNCRIVDGITGTAAELASSAVQCGLLPLAYHCL